MRKLVKAITKESIVVYIISQITTGLIFQNGLVTLLVTAVALTFAAKLFKPVVNLLLLPLNLITFGFFRWISSAITIYLVDLILPDFNLAGFHFAGFATDFLTMPPIDLGPGFAAYVAFSFLMSMVGTLVFWLLK